MNFPCLSAKGVFVIFFTLDCESNMKYYSSTMKYFVSCFYQSFLPPLKRVRSFDIAKLLLFLFRDSSNSFYSQTFESETRF